MKQIDLHSLARGRTLLPVILLAGLLHLANASGAQAAPSVPASPTPGSTSSPGPTVSSSTVALDWSNSSGATYYELGVRDMATNQLVVDTQVSSSAFTANLSAGKPYRWNVAACNSTGCSDYTAHRYFQTPGAVPPVPASPTPGSTSSPGPTVSSSTVALDWSNSTGATYYELGVRDMATNQLVVDTQVSSSAYTANLDPGKPYRWDVAACNSSGCSSPTADRYFQTPATVPATPGSPTPGSTSSPGPTVSSATVALDWSNSTGATYYDLGVRDLATNQLVVDTQTSSSAFTANLQPGKPYRWDVAACNSAGCSSATADRYFQTPAALPATPANPAPGSTTSPGPILASRVVQLTWSASSGATSYDIGVRDLVTNLLVIDQMTGGTSFSVTLERGKPYKWDVAACNSAGCSSPTADRYFQIQPLPATPANPAPGSTTSPGPALASPVVQLTWSASSGATTYDVGVRDLATNLLVIDQMTSNTSLTVTLESGKAYKWDVAACIAPDCSSPTADRYFTIAAASGVPDIAISPLTLTFEFDGFAFGDRSERPEARPAAIDWTEVARLEEKARETGTVRVILGLDAAFVPEGFLASDEIGRQRSSIAEAQEDVLNELASIQYRLVARFSSLPFLVVELDAAALSRVAGSDRIISIQEDIAVPPALASSGPVIGAPAAWAEGFDGSGQTVAILDTGVDKTHPFFSGGKVVAEACFSDGAGAASGLCPGGVLTSTASGSAAPCPASVSGCDHGTHVAGIAAGNGGGGSNIGIAREADIIAVQVFSRYNNAGDCAPSSAPCVRASPTDLVKALDHVYELRDDFAIASVNLSLGSGRFFDRATCDQSNTMFKMAVDQLRSVGIATVIATANNGYVDSIAWPACVSSAVSVGGTRDNDNLYELSNVASFVDLMAPGHNIVSAIPGTGTMSLEGTSMAAPHVAGAWAVLKQKNPDASVTEILGALRATATVVEDDRPNGVVTDLRRINVDEALTAIQNGQSFVISNTGNGSLSVTGLQLNQSASWISWSPQAPFTIAAGQSVSVTVTVDQGAAPAGSSSRRLLVTSNDPNESPYPNGVFINVEQTTAPECHSLTRTHTGNGNNPIASPTSSPGCPNGQFTAGASIQLTASPSSGWTVGGWTGTSNNGSTSLVNQVVMPDNNHTAGVTYLENAPEMLFDDGFESGNLDAWSVVGPVGGNIVVFSDDFNDGILDPERWTWYGHTVRETAGQFQVSCEVTDQGGGANTQFFRIARTGLVTLTRKARVFAGNEHFDGTLRFEPGEDEEKSFGISYANYQASAPGECSAVGFALFRQGVNAHWCESQSAHVSTWIPPIWGTLFDEKFEWNPATGAAAYYINGQLRLNMNVGALPAGVDHLRLRIGTWGWHTGHYHHSDDVRVTQQVQ